MGAELINLRRARKAKAKIRKRQGGGRQPVTHGTPKQLRDLAKAHADKARARLTRHKKD